MTSLADVLCARMPEQIDRDDGYVAVRSVNRTPIIMPPVPNTRRNFEDYPDLPWFSFLSGVIYKCGNTQTAVRNFLLTLPLEIPHKKCYTEFIQFGKI